MIEEIFSYLAENLGGEVLRLTVEHIYWTIIIISLACVIGISLGILATRKKALSPIILSIGDFGMATPNLALLFLALAFLRTVPAFLIALVTYALLPIMQNTVSGIEEVDSSIVEAAKGMGMNDKQILTKIEFPLALPVIIAGIRTSTVITIGAIAIAAYVGIGSLGVLILRGIYRPPLVHVGIAGAIICVLLVIMVEFLLEGMEKRMKTKGMGV